MQNDYDRIFKEEYLPLIAKIFTGLDYSNTQVLKDKIQVTPTLEREGDDFRMLLDKYGLPIYGFQLEIHVTDEDLRGRGQLHHAMFYHKHLLPLRQVVIYVGSKKKPSKIIRNKLELYGGNVFQFEVYVLNQLPAAQLIESNNPAEVILGILADFGKTNKAEFVRTILEKLFDLTNENAILFEKYARQLHVLSKLRKLQPIVKKELDNMPTQLFSIKDDLFFQKGVEQGIEIKRDRDVKNMLLKGFTPEVIADVLEVDIQHVLKIQKEIQDNIDPQKDSPQP